MSYFEILLFACTGFFAFLASIASFRKKPRTKMKLSFALLSFWYGLGNGLFLLDYFLQGEILRIFPVFGTILSLVLSFFLIGFGLNFPVYFRNVPKFGILSSFVLGFGVCLGLADYQNKQFILQSCYYTFSFGIFCLLVLQKLQYGFPALQRFVDILKFSTTVVVLLFIGCIFFSEDLPYNQKHKLYFILFMDLFFMITFLVFLYSYSLANDYLTHPFSFLLERTKKVFEQQVSANKENSRMVKEQLWLLYEIRNWKSLMDSFWFQILVDETLDNAVEHGGKRENDQITVHVYESKRFIDFYVIDNGKGFNPRNVPSPIESDRKLVTSGRGIHILKKLFQVRWNFLGNEINIRVDKSKQKDWK